ncbi:MAG: hypothetical protein US60_C0052G0009 [Microgenomates group bacterium GW2011_GWC1_37_8]|uniref:BioF2-like acetyltransferase domain-containing protein n=2 Tax=Parcubacteria group TaxID=1794811 RepID=A0A0G1KCC4_9BACT|nr:MAG: hypothetical protein US60_C0052G0009 [Microgenomates group bacterium GW2011_GWC1_37_8]KKT81200.1 MAG: hypothetical protein UW78_C0014G0005 [Candidatus Azambacteria bacterium GW2011_GWA1_44_9]OHA90521.1 MAG: hypothetical protein A2838_00910 [Candidatus Zambryskibacteria bacterium RIFCSPHIGHO2_01_FULL_46_25]
MMEAKAVSYEEVVKDIGEFPGLAYAREFLCFQEKHYSLKNIFLKITNDGIPTAIIAVNLKSNEAFSVYKDYAHLFFLDTRQKDFNWLTLANVVKKKIGASYFELQFAQFEGTPSHDGLVPSPLSIFVLSLNNEKTEADLLNLFDKKTRNEIRKSKRYGFEVKMIRIDMLDDIYALYIENMKRHGTPPKPMGYFEDLFHCFGEKCKCLGVLSNGELVGLNIFQVNKDYLRLIFNLSKVKFWNACVNNLLYYETIEWAALNGVKIIDFGPSLNNDHGHNRFKLGFGAKRMPIFSVVDAGVVFRFRKWIRQKWYNLRLRYAKTFNV